MGGSAYAESTINQFHSEQWPYSKYDGTCRNDEQQEFWFSAASEKSLGLTKYVSQADQSSNYSADENCSTTDSSNDAASVVSSQSSYTSAQTESTDVTVDDDVADSKHTFHTPSYVQEVQSRIDEQAELLSGLGSRPLTKQNIDCMQRLDAWRKERDVQTILENSTPISNLSQPPQPAPAAQQNAPATVIGSKCNRRRSGSQTITAGPPCKLKRDTESADCFVTLLIIFATRLITAIWPLSASPPMMSSCFNGAGVLPLRVFIQETLRRSKTSYSTLQVALFYLILLKDKKTNSDFTKEQPGPQDAQSASGERPQCRAMQCGRRMFLSALMLASKYLQDRNYSTRAWSKISGLRSAEINENEAEYLKSIDYKLHITKESFENWSKIVLTLSKLSKLQPGSRSSQYQDTPKPGSGMDSILADFVSEVEGYRSSDCEETYSDEWWTSLIRRLEPDLIRDSNKTDSFLRSNVPLDEVSELLARLDQTLPSAPASPESSVAYAPDMTFNEALQGRGTPTGVATPVNPTPAASPAKPTALPLRPQPRNLPTPQTTPRVPEGCPWRQTFRNPNHLRCSASVDALRSMRKQCILNANLERCPPPRRPHSLVLQPTHTLTRPAESKKECPSRFATPFVSSPTPSLISECTSRTARSRSSSISSNSSWSSWASGAGQTANVTNDPLQYSSPLARVSSLPEKPVTSDSSVPECTPTRTLRRVTPLTSSSVVIDRRKGNANSFLPFYRPQTGGFYDEGYGSSEEPISKMTARDAEFVNEFDAIHALMALSSRINCAELPQSTILNQNKQVQKPQLTSSPPRGHKRTISRTNDSLQDHVSQYLKLRGVDDEVIEDSVLSTHEIQSQKQWQMPTKSWATVKKPVSNVLDSKRLAMHCSALQYSSAPELTAQYLKDHMVTV